MAGLLIKDVSWTEVPLMQGGFTKVTVRCRMTVTCDYTTLGSKPIKTPSLSMPSPSSPKKKYKFDVVNCRLASQMKDVDLRP